MALESGDQIGELDAANPPGTDPLSQADDHLRLIKRCVQGSLGDMLELWAIRTNNTPIRMRNVADDGYIDVIKINDKDGVQLGGSTLIGVDNNPALYIEQSDLDPAFNRSGFEIFAGITKLTTRDSDNNLVSNDYQIRKDVTGGIRHQWMLSGIEALNLVPTGLAAAVPVNITTVDRSAISMLSSHAGGTRFNVDTNNASGTHISGFELFNETAFKGAFYYNESLNINQFYGSSGLNVVMTFDGSDDVDMPSGSISWKTALLETVDADNAVRGGDYWLGSAALNNPVPGAFCHMHTFNTDAGGGSSFGQIAFNSTTGTGGRLFFRTINGGAGGAWKEVSTI